VAWASSLYFLLKLANTRYTSGHCTHQFCQILALLCGNLTQGRDAEPHAWHGLAEDRARQLQQVPCVAPHHQAAVFTPVEQHVIACCMQTLVLGSPRVPAPPEEVLTDVAEQHLGASVARYLWLRKCFCKYHLLPYCLGRQRCLGKTICPSCSSSKSLSLDQAASLETCLHQERP